MNTELNILNNTTSLFKIGLQNVNFFNNRKIFIQNTDTSIYSKYKNLLLMLGFNTDNKAENYNFGYRCSMYRNDKPTWQSGKKTIPVKFGNTYEKYTFMPILTNDAIKKHLFSATKRIKARKLPFNQIDYNAAEYEIIGVNMRGCINTIGLNRLSGSNILSIDIDKELATKAKFKSPIKLLKRIADIFNIKLADFCFVEMNMLYGGGIHAYLKTDYNLTPEILGNIQEYLRGFIGVDVEMNFCNHILRLPCSYEYRPLRTALLDKAMKYSCTLPKKYYYQYLQEAIDESLINLQKKPIVIFGSNDVRRGMFKPELFGKRVGIHESRRQNKNPISLSAQSAKPIISNYNNSIIRNNNTDNTTCDNINNIVINSTKNNNISFFKKIDSLPPSLFGPGESWRAMCKQIPWLKAHGYTLEETQHVMMRNNNGSRLFRDISKANRTIKKFYDDCNATYKDVNDFYYDDKWISCKKYLENDDYTFINSKSYKSILYKIMLEVVDTILKNDNYTKDLKSTCKAIVKEKYKDYIINALPIFVNELLGRYEFRKKYRYRTTLNDIKRFSGMQLSIKEMELLQDYVSHRFNNYHKFNSKQLRVILLKILQLEPVENTKMIKSCTFWQGKLNIKDVFLDFKVLIKSILGKIKTFVKSFIIPKIKERFTDFTFIDYFSYIFDMNRWRMLSTSPPKQYILSNTS